MLKRPDDVTKNNQNAATAAAAAGTNQFSNCNAYFYIAKMGRFILVFHTP
jgi:hypothetical protein